MNRQKFLIASLLIAGWSFGCGNDSASSSGIKGDGCKCTGDQICVDKVCYDPSELCGGKKCGESQTCVEGVCKDNDGASELCDGKKCGESQTCVDGVCKDNDGASELCGGKKCSDSQVCKDDKCVEKSELCGDAVCKDSESCVNNSCAPKDKVCGESVCNDVEVCKDSVCVPKDKVCGESVCADSEACKDGSCVSKDKVCGANVCSESQTCRDNQCIDSEKICGADVCSDAQVCVTGQCIDKEKICGESVCSGSQVCHANACVASEQICGDAVCQDQQICTEGVCKDPEPAQILAILDGSAVVSEDGSTVQISVSLATKPESDVVITVASSNTNELAASPATLTFTPENWNTPQVIEAAGVDDHVIDGAVKSSLMLSSASEDADYEGLSKQIDITTEDNDSAGLVVISSGLSLAENGEETAQFTVALTAEPASDVVVSLESSDISELVVDGEASLTFTKDNWNTPQIVTVKPVDDDVADGVQSAFVKLTSASEDANFNLLEAQTEPYMITDNETPGVVISSSATTLTPAASEIEVSISLTAEPTSDVTVSLGTTNDNTESPAQNVFTFTTENWNVPQKVTVTNTDPMSASAAVTTEKLFATAAGEGVYQSVQSNEIELKIYAVTSIDVPKARTCEMQKFTLLPGKYRLEAWGAQGGSDGPGGGKPGHVGGLGGYATGIIELTETKDIYVMVGEYSLDFNNHPGFVPCNGGGVNSGGATGAGGGGATHFAATELGDLPKYENSKSDVYLVAGGGGGAGDYAEGGSGGGESGGNGVGSNSGAGATQTTGYKFGQGEPASGQNPGGGGGWYGGKRSNGGVNAGGGGGSGYIGGVLNGEMTAGVQQGDGKAKITVIED